MFLPMNAPTAPAAGTVIRPLTVVYLATASLVPDPRNARTHPKRQIEQIKASITAFGFNNPILADEQGRLIAGASTTLNARSPPPRLSCST